MRKKFLIIVGPISFLMIWGLLSYTKLLKPIFLPPPDQVGETFIKLFYTVEIYPDLYKTIFRWLSGLFIGTIFGIPLGLIMGYSDKVYSSIEIVYDFFRSIPVMTLFPLFLVFFGVGDKSKIAVSAWASFLFVALNTIYGVRHSKEIRVYTARVMGANKIQTFLKFVLPGSMPDIFAGIRVSISLALIVVVASEMIMGTSFGLGKRIFDASLVYRMEEVYSIIIITGLLGFFANKLAFTLESKLIHWRGK